LSSTDRNSKKTFRRR